MGLNAYEARLRYCRDKGLPELSDMYALRTILVMLHRTPLFKRPLNISEFVELTEDGDEWFEALKTAFPDHSEDLLMENTFRRFYWEKFFFNASGCDISGLEEIINDRILSGGFIIPWIYKHRILRTGIPNNITIFLKRPRNNRLNI